MFLNKVWTKSRFLKPRYYAKRASKRAAESETLDLSKLKQVDKNVFIEEKPEDHFQAKTLQTSFGNKEMDTLNKEYEKEVKRKEKEILGKTISEEEAYMDQKELFNRPMKDFTSPNFKIEPFNYKTFRYKDISDSDFIAQNENEVLVGLEEKAASFTDTVLEIISNILKREKGRDIVAIDISYKTNWVPRMIIVTAESARHCVALAKTLKEELKDLKLVRNAKIERNEGDEWVVLSTGTIVVEIMTEASRDYMDIERLWVLKRSAQETFLFDLEEERFMYDEEDGMWDDDDEYY